MGMWGFEYSKESLSNTYNPPPLPGSRLPPSLGLQAQRSTWHKAGTQSLLSKGYHIYYGSSSTLCVSEHLIKWAALSWPLSLKVSRTGPACSLTLPSSTGLWLLKLFFIHTHKNSQGSACFGRTYTKIWTIQGGLIISMTPAKRWCAHLWWFHICKKHPIASRPFG